MLPSGALYTTSNMLPIQHTAAHQPAGDCQLWGMWRPPAPRRVRTHAVLLAVGADHHRQRPRCRRPLEHVVRVGPLRQHVCAVDPKCCTKMLYQIRIYVFIQQTVDVCTYARTCTEGLFNSICTRARSQLSSAQITLQMRRGHAQQNAQLRGREYVYWRKHSGMLMQRAGVWYVGAGGRRMIVLFAPVLYFLCNSLSFECKMIKPWTYQPARRY